MLELVFASGATTAPGPDIVARILAVCSLLATSGLGIYTIRSQVWRGRASFADDLREPLTEVRDTLAAADQNPSNAQRLWSPTTTVYLQSLRLSAERVADKRLKKLLNQFLSAVSVAKGDAPPTPAEATDPQPLSAPQLEGLRRAATFGKAIDERMNLSARRGA